MHTQKQQQQHNNNNNGSTTTTTRRTDAYNWRQQQQQQQQQLCNSNTTTTTTTQLVRQTLGAGHRVVVEGLSTCQDSHLTGKPGAGQGSPLRVAPCPVQSDTGLNYYIVQGTCPTRLPCHGERLLAEPWTRSGFLGGQDGDIPQECSLSMMLLQPVLALVWVFCCS